MRFFQPAVRLALCLALILVSPGSSSFHAAAAVLHGSTSGRPVSLPAKNAGTAGNSAYAWPRGYSTLAGLRSPTPRLTVAPSLQAAPVPGASVNPPHSALLLPQALVSPVPAEGSAAGRSSARGLFGGLGRWVSALGKTPEDSSRRLFDRSTSMTTGTEPVVGDVSDKKAVLSPSTKRPSTAGPIAKAFKSPVVRYGAPAAILGVATLVLHASLLPVAVISVSLLASVMVHETAHILGLRVWGDKTPRLAGRDSMNPLRNISMVGTVLMPAASLALSMATIGFPILLGWAKPVPVDFNNLRDVKRDAAKVAIMGPLANLALGLVAGAVWWALPAAAAAGAAGLIAGTLFKMNLTLAAFNLLPVPWLDGGKALVGLAPKSWYAKWVYNPKLPKGYQTVFKRIYEGPANLLSKLHVHDLEQVNTLTRVASFLALGAVYAVFWTVLSVPLLFLALPCSYDYWCIREKVRSEAAVQDLMRIMSRWSSLIVQIAEDLDAQSEVSAYETEHAMKNALETLIDELMAKPDFAALSDAQKTAEVLRLYPEYAVKYLKEKALTEDAPEKILEILRDPRNAPYYDELRKWLETHEIFSRWKGAHAHEKPKDEAKKQDEGKTGSAGFPGAVGVIVALLGLAHLFPDAVPLLSLLGGAALLGTMTAGERSKIAPNSGFDPHAVSITFAPGTGPGEAQQLLTRHGLAGEVFTENGSYVVALDVRGRSIPALARALVREDSVLLVKVHPGGVPGDGPSAASKVRRDAAVEPGALRVEFASALDEARQTELLARHGLESSRGAFDAHDGARVLLRLPAGRDLAPLALALAEEAEVGAVKLNPADDARRKVVASGMYSGAEVHISFTGSVESEAIASLLGRAGVRPMYDLVAANHYQGVTGIILDEGAFDEALVVLGTDERVRFLGLEPSRAAAYATPAPAALSDAELAAKLRTSEDLETRSLVVEFHDRALASQAAETLARRGLSRYSLSGYEARVDVAADRDIAAVVRALAAEPLVARVKTSPLVAALLPRPTALPKVFVRPEGGSLPILSTWFAPGLTEAQVSEALRPHGSRVVHRADDGSYSVVGVDMPDLVAKARALSADPLVAKVYIHEDVAAELAGAPTPAATTAVSQAPKLSVDAGLPPLKLKVRFRLPVRQGAERRQRSEPDERRASAALEALGLPALPETLTLSLAPDGDWYVAEYDAPSQALLDRAAQSALADARVDSVVMPARLDKVRVRAEEWAWNLLGIFWRPGTGYEEQKLILERLGLARTFLTPEELVLGAPQSAAEMPPYVRLLAAHPAVAALTVTPSVMALLNQPAQTPTAPAAAPTSLPAPVFDPARAVLAQFIDGFSREAMESFARSRGLRLVEADYRGGKGLVLYELPAGGDVSAFIVEQGDDEEMYAISDLRPFRLDETAVVETKAAEPVEAAPRDVEAEWLDFLNRRKLLDGTTFKPAQAAFLATFLKPVKSKEDAPVPPTVARSAELKRLIPILTSPRGMRNSAILVGEAGVGKTAVAEGLAALIEEAELAAQNGATTLDLGRLKGRWLVELDLDALLADDKPVDALRALLKLLPLLNDPEPGSGNQVIVLMDEVQKLLDDPQSGSKFANALKGVLRDGRLSVLATTTAKEYKKHVEPDDAFRRRLERIFIDEPGVAQTLEMLRGAKEFLEKIHDAVIPDAALEAAAKLFAQFDTENFNPDKSFKGVRDSAELARPGNLRAALALDLRDTWRQLVLAINEARQELADKAIPSALALPVELYNRIAELSAEAAALAAEQEAVEDGKGAVTVELIKRTLATKTGITSGQLTLGEEDTARYLAMEEEIARRVVGQGRAVKALAAAIRRNKAGLSNPGQPMAKFLFAGPTGTGKTYLAKELARFLFKDPEAMIRIDMSEYMQKHEVSKLIGAPPGYVGYGEGGQLTEAVRKKPYSVILLDEVEKAHPDAFNILLQVLDDGRLTDSMGRTVDFKNTVILFSSNAGMKLVDSASFERGLAEAKTDEARAQVEAAWDKAIAEAVKLGVTQGMPAEFINRLDEDPFSKNKWVLFDRLKASDMGKIARIRMAEFKTLLLEGHGTELEVSDAVYDLLAVEGFSPVFGARPMKSAIEKLIIDRLAEFVLQEAQSGRSDVRGGLVKVDVVEGKIVFEATKKPEARVERATVAGAAQELVRRILESLESRGPEPSQRLLENWLTPADEESAGVGKTGFSPDVALKLPPSAKTVAASHNNAKKADPVLRGVIKEVAAEARAAGYSEEAVAALEVATGAPGVGWLKHFAAHAKAMGATEPITVTAQVGKDAVRVAIHSGHAMTDQEAAVLRAHFTGSPPTSLQDAMTRADMLNLGEKSVLRDSNLLDLYRRLLLVPGARWGYARGPAGTDYWIEIPSRLAAAGGESESPAVQNGTALPINGGGSHVVGGNKSVLTPHQEREYARARGFLIHMLESTQQLPHPSVMTAAADSFALLSGPAQLETARAWLAKASDSGDVAGSWPQVLAAALVLERFGGPADISRLESVARRLTDRSHVYMPLHEALASAVAAVYARAGWDAAKAAYAALPSGGGNSETDIRAGLERALETLRGDRQASEDVKDPEALAIRFVSHPRDPRVAQWRRELAADSDKWKSASAAEKIAVLRQVAADARDSADVLATLGLMITRETHSDRVTNYAAAKTFADLVVRENRVGGLSGSFDEYLESHTLTTFCSDWAKLIALVHVAEAAGGADVLGPLEFIMNVAPGSVSADHEQAFFLAPGAWAKIVVRAGLFPEYAREGGKLQQMMTSTNPMLLSAALYAMAYARLGVSRPTVSSPLKALPFKPSQE